MRSAKRVHFAGESVAPLRTQQAQALQARWLQGLGLPAPPDQLHEEAPGPVVPACQTEEEEEEEIHI